MDSKILLHHLAPNLEHLYPVVTSFALWVVQLALIITLIILSKSNYYLIFYVIFISLDFLALFSALLNHKHWFREDFYPFDEFSISGTIQLWQSSPKTLKVVRWRVVKLITWIFMIVSWLRALWLYGQVIGSNFGLGVSMAGLSSCTTTFTSSDPNAVFNDKGGFAQTQQGFFSWDKYYVQCVFSDVTWANPKPFAQHLVKGYNRISSQIEQLDCSTEVPTGYVSVKQCPDSYPDPTLGVQGPVVTGTRTSSVTYCPGNANNGFVCFNSADQMIPCTTATPEINRIPGKPYKLCPVCLNSLRQMSGDPTAGDGFENCPKYSESEGSQFACLFCPGNGYGWLANEVTSTNDTIVNFWLCTTISLFLPFIEIVTYYAIVLNLFDHFR